MSESEEHKAPETPSLEIPNLRDKILAALKTVYDPEIPVDMLS